LKVSLLTGGQDEHYAFGLLGALISKGINVDFIGNDDMSKAEIVADKRVNFFNLRGNQNRAASSVQKITRVLTYYCRLLRYAATTDSRLFHILWLNKFLLFDSTLLNVYYKLLGKQLVFTAHNVDIRERDGGNNFLNRLSLKILYTLVDHIFVHTTKMKSQLIQQFSIKESKVSVIPFGINDALPKSDLTKSEARARLQLNAHHKTLLCFGNIAPYKGLEYAIHAMDRLIKKDDTFRLVIAGQIKGGCQQYWDEIERVGEKLDLGKYIIKKIEYIPDEEVEVYFKSSDVLLLPYRSIFQSGILIMSYSFGLPVVAADVGSLREDVMEGRTGTICRPEDPDDLADTICRYFESNLFRDLELLQKDIIDYGNEKHSWEEVGNITHSVYKNLLAGYREKNIGL
jgi:D-inositol-3-phosphate glycosyltransferase